MIVDMYNQFRANPAYNKLVGRDYMIMEYKCPIETELFQLMTEMNIITYIITGEKDWTTADQTVKVKAGDALFVRKGVYTVRQYFDVDHCVLTFFVNDDFIRRFMLEHRSGEANGSAAVPADCLFKLDVTDALRSLFLSVYHYMKMGSEIPQGLVEMKFSELLYNIVLNPSHTGLKAFFSSIRDSRSTSLDDVMLRHFRHDLSVEDFARLCGRSLSAFKRDFAVHFGKTPARWLKDRRLEFAISLLTTSDLAVNEVGFESGFGNASHFNTAFRLKFGVSPMRYRTKTKITAG